MDDKDYIDELYGEIDYWTSEASRLKDAAKGLLDFVASKHEVANIDGFTCPHLRELAELTEWKKNES